MEKLKSLLLERKHLYPELCLHKNFEKRLKWELIEVEVQDLEEYFLKMFYEDKSNCIDKDRLEKHIVFKYFEFFEYEILNSKNIAFVKKVLKVYIMFSTKKQDCHYQYQYVKLRNEE